MAPLPIAKPSLDEREVEAARRAILSGWVTQGPEVAAFEREFAEYVGAPYACAVSSGTTALHLALLAAGVIPGDEVITVSHSFIATANAVRYCGAIPVFVDIRSDTLNIDPDLVEAAITSRTRAILCVHQLGMPCDLAALSRIARFHGIALVEDAACAIGSEVLEDGVWRRIGKPHSDFACFSFHPRKLVTTGDGGMVTTSEAARDRWLRLVRQHGMSVPDTVRHSATEVIFEQYPVLGFNYRMTDIQAAIGREQLKKLPALVERRRELAARYSTLLCEIGVEPPVEPAWAKSNWQSYCVRLPEGCDQRPVMQALLEHGISSRRGVMCAHREAAYQGQPWICGLGRMICTGKAGCSHLKESERATDRTIILPLFADMSEADQDRVVEVLAGAMAAAVTS
jgi:perosamine synthetase